MTELEKMMAFHAMQTIKEALEWSQDMQLVLICKMDKTGRFERLARILASHNMPTKEIVPCVMDIFQDFLIECETEGEHNVIGQSDQIREGTP